MKCNDFPKNFYISKPLKFPLSWLTHMRCKKWEKRVEIFEGQRIEGKKLTLISDCQVLPALPQPLYKVQQRRGKGEGEYELCTFYVQHASEENAAWWSAHLTAHIRASCNFKEKMRTLYSKKKTLAKCCSWTKHQRKQETDQGPQHFSWQYHIICKKKEETLHWRCFCAGNTALQKELLQGTFLEWLHYFISLVFKSILRKQIIWL